MNKVQYDQGLSFPVQFTPEGSPVYSGLEASVDASVRIILSWTLGQRIYDAIFGSITSYLNWPSIPIKHQFLLDDIRHSILDNDSRVEDVDVKIGLENNGARVMLEALVKIKNSSTIIIQSEI